MKRAILMQKLGIILMQNSCRNHQEFIIMFNYVYIYLQRDKGEDRLTFSDAYFPALAQFVTRPLLQTYHYMQDDD